jgi:DNA-directed RNA polymerase subunit M/transcription elongation factor TFIIS
MLSRRRIVGVARDLLLGGNAAERAAAPDAEQDAERSAEQDAERAAEQAAAPDAERAAALDYAVRLEHEVYIDHIGDVYEYELAMYDGLSKLQANGPWIRANLTPEEMPAASWRQKSTGLEVMAIETETTGRAAAFRALLRQNVESVKASTREGTETVKCNKCGSIDVSILLRQTRSADEGMSSFATCQNCGSRWKLN